MVLSRQSFIAPQKRGYIMKAPYRLLYNNDSTNTAGVISPFHEEGEPFREEMLVASIEEVADKGVEAYMLSPGMGWVPWWQSKFNSAHYKWWKERTGLEVKGWHGCGYDRYVYEGGDMVQVLIDTCRRHEMAPFVSLRLNDVHLLENYAKKNQESLVCNRFYAEHPEWHIDPNHPQVKGYYGGRGMNWAIPQVRQYKLELIKELAKKYDLDGIELDFLRDNTLFRDGEVENAERIEIITGFVGEVRKALDAKSGPRRHLCVRIPTKLAAHPSIGLDVVRLQDVGVDMFNLSSWYHTVQQTDIVSTRKLLPDASIYLEMTHSTGNHWYYFNSAGIIGNPRTSDHQFYTTAHLALEKGFDGLSLFNFVYYRMGHTCDVPVMEPPFDVLPKLNDRAFLARQSHEYMIASHPGYFEQLPRQLNTDKSETFTLDIASSPRLAQKTVPGTPKKPEFETIKAPIRLRLHTEKPLKEKSRIAASMNGKTLQPTEDTTRFFGNPFDAMISPVNHRCAWIVPEGALVNGLNDLSLQLTSGEGINIIHIDLGIPNKGDARRSG
jgi:hypothetical protein